MFEKTMKEKREYKEYYPTPESVAEKMLEQVDFTRVWSVLEPSAGEGKLVNAIKEKMIRNRYYDAYKAKDNKLFDIDCVEKDKYFRYVLAEKGYRVVHDDFLTYDTYKEYDLIVMNPPFSNGASHLLKAINMQKRNGGGIVCLLNAETIKNPFSNERKELLTRLDEYGADITFLTEAFVDAERKTMIEIAIVKVKLPEIKRESIFFSDLRKAEIKEVEETDPRYEVVENDLVKSITRQYKRELEAGIRLIREYYSMSPLLQSQFQKEDEKTVQSGGCLLQLSIEKEPATINSYVQKVRKKYWKALFENPKFTGRLTDKLRREYMNKIDDLKNYDFSEFNICEIRLNMNKHMLKGVEDAILELFEELSYKHYYDDSSNNIHYYNGWKTNKAWIINKKVILPLNAFGFMGNYYPMDYKVREKLMDIEKCFNYLDCGLTDALDLEGALAKAQKEEQTGPINLKYFTVKFYKKGTCHIIFKNEELLKKFNIFGSQKKGWLPPSYGTKKYKEMSKEEQEVVKSFDSEKGYEHVMRNTNYYITKPGTLLLESSEGDGVSEKTA